MRILVLGASGYIGRHVSARFVADGHDVTALVRSTQGAATAGQTGACTVLGDLAKTDELVRLVKDQDAVVWIAQLMLDDEHRVVRALLEALHGTGKTFIFTSGTSLLSERTNGEWIENSYAEDDSFIPRRQIAPRLAIENMVRESATRGVRAMCVRPPLIWGNGGSKVISDFYHSARRTGAVCYVGRGLNVYSNVHVEDLADLFSRALKRGVPGALYHCVSGEVNYRTMAETIARHLGIPTRSIEVAEAIDVWDKFTGPIVFSSCSRTRSKRARAELGWQPDPARADILEECTNPAYLSQQPRTVPAHVKPATA
ncbi:NAD-dependent epimerase/dehydratase family protein [Arthrobacter sp. I2-34]|uniref:NAD-dependent epimerase/dehydratase family protein n=1 Tax=Arthrobacter hankyongi TaxID=2904801 RepID=A0ABS9L3M7_9MICC|nr:NAD-dependent epimerase/dehydratase family protein [Arthrobacter hankyongi]MCG2621265.1 NAD-dependent epimerase/dehydratase family protein [Arthrobacter hankyongi]